MTWERVRLERLNLNHDERGMIRFLNALNPFWDDHPAVILDLTCCTFINAEGAALLAAFVLRRRSWGGKTRIDWETGTPKVRRQLGRWQLTELFGRENFPWTDNAIPLLHQESLDGEAVEGYICTVMRAGENMPAMTPELVKQTNSSLCELFVNIFEHAESPCGGLAIGQYFPIKKQVQFCVCDAGRGLVSKVQAAGYALDSAEEAITWALGEGHTTKLGLGGLGLFVLQDFVKMNGGSLRILANDGYFELNGETGRARKLPVSYGGTLIQIGLLIRDGVVYTVQEE
jgi:hypothetical protein